MIPLALTSTTGWIRRLGGKRWQLLHRLIYISAIAGVVHYYWLIKSAIQRPIFYGCLVALLLSDSRAGTGREAKDRAPRRELRYPRYDNGLPTKRLLSIIVPVYNEEEFLAASILRAMDAPLPDGLESEIVAVDDGSTDCLRGDPGRARRSSIPAASA